MDWIPAISTNAILLVIGWLGRNLIITRLTYAVKYVYDEKLEVLRAILRNSDESFKAELKAKESQINALSSGALSGIVKRQSALYKHQLHAVEQLLGGRMFSTPS